MNEAPTVPPTAPAIAPAEIAFSCRLPLLVLFVSAAAWLVIGSAFGLIASIKFHSPNFLAESPYLTYGHVRPAYVNSLLYGCCLQGGLGVVLWVFTHLGLTNLAQRWLVTLGAMLWNLGVTVGVGAILAGDTTGFENLEMPGCAALPMFLGYLAIGIWAVLTFHRRQRRPLFVSQWFLLTALFWFPWIYSTANLLLVSFPVRGVTQAVIGWWYSNNLQLVWFSLVGLAAIFYFIPKLVERELHSHYLALFTYWMLVLFGAWGGIPNTAPVPAWMPTLSTISAALMLVPVLAVAVNLGGTLSGAYAKLTAQPPLLFFVFGAVAFLLAGLLSAAGALLDAKQLLHFTWFAVAQQDLNQYGFLVMVLFGVVYRVLPQLTATELPWPKLVRAHFWLAAAGVVFLVVPFAAGGLVQAVELGRPDTSFSAITQSMLPFLRTSTVGDLLLAVGHVLFLTNLAGLVVRFYRAKAAAAYAVATADLFKAAEAKA